MGNRDSFRFIFLSSPVLQVCYSPGIAVTIVKDGKVIHAKGYGVRSLKEKQIVV